MLWKRKSSKRDWCSSALIVMLAGLLAGMLVSCRSFSPVTIQGSDGEPMQLDRAYLESLKDFQEEIDGQMRLPLERVLAREGYAILDSLQIEQEGAVETFTWGEIAEQAWLLPNGTLVVGENAYRGPSLKLQSDERLAGVQAQITDLAPTVAAALKLAPPALATGTPLLPQAELGQVERVAMIFLDGFGYLRYQEALNDDLIPFLASLAPPRLALGVYPPITSVSSAAMLTGAPPSANGVAQRGMRITEAETIFDLACAAGLQVVAVEGNALAFNLRNAELTLSGDRDGNGSTDDNVLVNALAALEAGAPHLLWIHFHGIDDAGHTYGPGAVEEKNAILGVDAAVGQILERLPPGTLALIFADHGMHQVDEDGRLGNHGHLIARDMLIPIFIVLN